MNSEQTLKQTEASKESTQYKSPSSDESSHTHQKWFGYIRQSKKDNSQHTLVLQKKSIIDFAKRHDIREENIVWKQEEASAYGDEDASDVDLSFLPENKKRGEFEKMMADLLQDYNKHRGMDSNREYAGIICFDSSRLSRNARDFLSIEKLMGKGYRVLSVCENIVDSAPGFFFFRSLQIEAIYYSDRQSSKASRYALHALMNDPCKSLGGNSPGYGYVFVEGKSSDGEKASIEKHPINSTIVNRIYELKAAGKQNRAIQAIIKEEFEEMVTKYNSGNIGGNKNKMSMPATLPDDKVISDILLNKSSIQYDGRRNINLSTRFAEDVKLLQMTIDNAPRGRIVGNTTIKKGENILSFYVPEFAIVDTQIYNQVANKRPTRSNNQEHNHLYGDKLFCDDCGGKLYGRKEGGEVYYQCNNAKHSTSTREETMSSCESKTRLSEKEVNKFLSKEILPYITIKPSHPDYGRLIAAFKKMELKTLNDILSVERGHLTKIQNRISLIEADEDCSYEEKETIIEELQEKEELKIADIIHLQEQITGVESIRKEGIELLFSSMDEFIEEDRETQYLLTNLIVERIDFSEIRKPEYRYKGIRQRGNSEQYQKLITRLKLRPYWHELFTLNRYHNYENGK